MSRIFFLWTKVLFYTAVNGFLVYNGSGWKGVDYDVRIYFV